MVLLAVLPMLIIVFVGVVMLFTMATLLSPVALGALCVLIAREVEFEREEGKGGPFVKRSAQRAKSKAAKRAVEPQPIPRWAGAAASG